MFLVNLFDIIFNCYIIPCRYEIYSKHTGKSVDQIKSALERDNFMTAESAKSFGLIDEVVEKRS